MSSRQKNTIPALGGNNPDYYAETASIAPGSPSQGQQHYSRPPPPPVQQQQQQQHYQQQPYYPPPPNQGYNSSNTPPYYQPPPPGNTQAYDDIPPPKPPRPVSGSAGVGNVAPSSSSSAPPPPSTSTGKPTFGERLHQWSVKAGVPINKVTNKLGSEAFWPSTMDLECDKAARILKSFCKDGFYTTASAQDTSGTTGVPPLPPRPGSSGGSGPKSKPKVLVKIPQSVIQSAAGLAIFTTFRTGLHLSGAGGSGIVVARLPSGAWSPPSGFLVHTLGAGFMVGLDIYDCVCVLRTPEAVRAFTRPRVSLGGEIGLVAGPVGAGAAVDAAIGARSTKPVWSYMKSRGLYAGVQADGTVVIARPDANAAFYGRGGITAEEILAGNVPSSAAQQGGGGAAMWPLGGRRLMEVLKAAEGRRDVDEGVLREVGGGPTLGDLGMGDTEKEVVVSSGSWDGRY